MRCLTEKEAADLVSGFLDAGEAAAATAHAAQCEVCTKRLNRFTEVRDGLGPDTGEFEDDAFGAEIMTLIDLGRAEKERLPSAGRAALWKRWGGAAAAAAVLVSMTVFQLSSGKDLDVPSADLNGPEKDSRFASRGVASSADQWVSLTLFERRDLDGKAVFYPVDETVSKDAVIASAYEDRSASPFSYLMVLAVDPNGEIFWYYPAYESNGGDQMSIATQRTQGKTPLPDEVTHDLSLGALRFFGIFSREPLHAAKIEETVKNQLAAAGDLSKLTRIDIEGTGQWTRQIQVQKKGDE